MNDPHHTARLPANVLLPVPTSESRTGYCTAGTVCYEPDVSKVDDVLTGESGWTVSTK